jgi:integrase
MARFTVYNNIQTEENISRINKKNLELLEEWKEYLVSSDKSMDTVTQYSNDVMIFFIWLLENADNKFFVNITKRDIIKYQNYLLSTLKLSSSRIRRLKASISSLSNYIVRILDDEYKEFKNIINFIPAPNKEVVREKTVLEDEEVERVLKQLTDEKEYQIACILALAAYSGGRKSELLRFKLSYFTEENIVSGMYRTPEKIKTKGRGRNGKQLNRFVLACSFKPFLDNWIEERNRLGVPENIDDLFVVSRDEKYEPMKINTLDTYAKRLSKYFNTDFYFHAMRHFFTTALYKNGIPAELIKKIVGWESVEMVSIYTDIEATDEFDKYFDANGMKK